MRARTGLALLACIALRSVAVVPSASAGPATKVADEPYSAEFRARVRKAIEQGMNHLRTEQLRAPALFVMDDVEYQEAGAVAWVLRRADVPQDDPTLAKALKRLRARQPRDVEEAGLLLLALCAEPLAAGDPFGIGASAKDDARPPGLSGEHLPLVESTVKFLVARQVKEEGRGRFGWPPDSTGGWRTVVAAGSSEPAFATVPATCLALLGLEAAARKGVEVPAATFSSALSLLLAWQAPKGHATALKMNEVRGTVRHEWSEAAHARGFGWGGSVADRPTGYDTVAGAVGLVVCQDALQKDPAFTQDLRKKTREALRDALAWVQRNYDIKRNPVQGEAGDKRDLGSTLHHHHWLQGLARLAIHARMRYVGTHDWYQEGAEELLKTQRPDGSWGGIWWMNCYAMLFLLRASLPSIAPVVTPGG